MNSIYNYSNYHQFLKEYVAEKRQSDPSFNFEALSRKLGFETPFIFRKIIYGKRKIRNINIRKLAKKLEFGKKEADFFVNLVLFNDTRKGKEKDKFYKKMVSSHKSHALTRIRQDQYSYFAKWYNPVIRELVTFLDFKDDYRKLGQMLKPAISPVQARNAVKLLLRLGLIRQEEGGYVHVDKTITTGDDVRSVSVRKFQKENMKLAAEAVNRFDPEFRDISSLTFGASPEVFKELKTEIRAFRKHLIKIIETHEPVDRVCQINFQLFPLSRELKKGVK